VVHFITMVNNYELTMTTMVLRLTEAMSMTEANPGLQPWKAYNHANHG